MDEELALIYQKLKTLDNQAKSKSQFLMLVSEAILQTKIGYERKIHEKDLIIEDQKRSIAYLQKVVKQQKSQLGLFG